MDQPNDDIPELIPAHQFITDPHTGPQVLFFEQHTGYMLWRERWWVQLDGYWFQIHSEPMEGVLTARWTHLHSLRPKPKEPTADLPPQRMAREVTTVETSGDAL